MMVSSLRSAEIAVGDTNRLVWILRLLVARGIASLKSWVPSYFAFSYLNSVITFSDVLMPRMSTLLVSLTPKSSLDLQDTDSSTTCFNDRVLRFLKFRTALLTAIIQSSQCPAFTPVRILVLSLHFT